MKLPCLAWGSCLALSFGFAAACGEDEPPPRSREQFCHAWAKAACSANTVKYCEAEDAEACIDSQDEFCHDLVPDDFSDARGDECIDAVNAAYKDGELEADELSVVLRLGEPCNELVVGPGEEGDSCLENNDCNTSIGLACIRKSDNDDGTCEEPEEVGGGRSCDAAQKTCEAGFYCNGENCVEAKAEGRPCTIQEECGEDGFCDGDGMCAARLAVRSECSEDYECEIGICDRGTCRSLIRLASSEPLCDDLR